MQPIAETPLRRTLKPGERLLWAGQPNVRAYTWAYTFQGGWQSVLCALFVTGVAVFWTATALIHRAPLISSALGLAVGAAGLYVLFGRTLLAWRAARRTWYGLTDQRVLVLTGAFRQHLISTALSDLPSAQLLDSPSGIGTIAFPIEMPAAPGDARRRVASRYRPRYRAGLLRGVLPLMGAHVSMPPAITERSRLS